MPDYTTPEQPAVTDMELSVKKLLSAFRSLDEADQLLFAEAIAAKGNPDKVIECIGRMSPNGVTIMMYVIKEVQ